MVARPRCAGFPAGGRGGGTIMCVVLTDKQCEKPPRATTTVFDTTTTVVVVVLGSGSDYRLGFQDSFEEGSPSSSLSPLQNDPCPCN